MQHPTVMSPAGVTKDARIMKKQVVRLAGLLLLLLVLPAALQNRPQEGDTVDTFMETYARTSAADRFLEAYTRGDEAAMRAILDLLEGDPPSPKVDPVRLADILLQRHLRSAPLPPACPDGDRLAAARKLAEMASGIPKNSGLPALVERWCAYSEEEMEVEWQRPPLPASRN